MPSYLLLHTERQILRDVFLRLGLFDKLILHSLEVDFVLVEDGLGVLGKVFPMLPGYPERSHVF